MKRLLAVFAALAVVAAWLSACCVSPAAVAPPYEPTPGATQSPASGDQSGGTATPTPSPKSDGLAATPTRTPLDEEESMTPQPTQGTPDETLPYEARPVVEMAKKDLARRLELSISEISVISVEAVDWPDSSLGCPQPGKMYAQVITPGYLIALGVKGQAYEYHSGGEQLLLCEETAKGHSRPDPVVIDGHPWMPRDADIEPTPPRH